MNIKPVDMLRSLTKMANKIFLDSLTAKNKTQLAKFVSIFFSKV